MDGFRTQSPSIVNRGKTLSSIAVATSSSSALHANPNGTPQNPIHPFSQPTKFHPSIPPSVGPPSLLGFNSLRLPLPMTSSASSCHFFPSSSKGPLKEEPSCSSSSTASDSDYDSAPLRSSASLQRRSADNDSLMATQRYDPTDVTMGNDDQGLLFNEETTTKTEDESRRRIRRERNKQAAARCRQRRVDLTNHLMAETETLDTVRADLQREVENLVRQKNQLEFILQAHTTQCRMVPSSSSAPGSIPEFVKLESSDKVFLRPLSTSSQVSGSTISTQVNPHRQLLQGGPSMLNSSNQMAPNCSANQMTTMTSANHTSSMSCATMTLPTTSDAELLVSPMTLDAMSSFDFGFDILDAQEGPTRVTGVPSSSSTSVIHNYGDGISPTLLNL